MADAAQHKFDCVPVWKLDRFGRSVLHLNQQLAALTSYGVRFIATSQGLDTDQSNPTSRLLLQILASVVARLRDQEGLSWRAISKRLGVPVMTVVDAHKRHCTETVVPEPARQTTKKKGEAGR